MSESMPGWGEFQSALSQLQSVAGGGGTAGGGGAGGAGGGMATPANTNFVQDPRNYDAGGGGYGAPVAVPSFGTLDMGGYEVGIDVGAGSGVSAAQRNALLARGFRSDPTDSSERLYGSGDIGEFRGIPRRSIHPVGHEPFPGGGFLGT